jgi:hypothetical protein
LFDEENFFEKKSMIQKTKKELDFKKFKLSMYSVFEIKELEEEFYNFIKNENKSYYLDFLRDIEILLDMEEDKMELKMNEIINGKFYYKK